jgi:hypothetical protein
VLQVDGFSNRRGPTLPPGGQQFRRRVQIRLIVLQRRFRVGPLVEPKDRWADDTRLED